MTISQIDENCVGILAYGSLIDDPGVELLPVLKRRIPTATPFPVEYARLSQKRGGAPTVVPHSTGNPVNAEVLVLYQSVSLGEARNLLWRRETRHEGSGRTYRESAFTNALAIRDEPGFCGLDHVLYTDFNPAGKLGNPDPKMLAEAAIRSVATAPPGRDGVSYLMALLNAGVETALTQDYVENILAITGSGSLVEALDSLRRKV